MVAKVRLVTPDETDRGPFDVDGVRKRTCAFSESGADFNMLQGAASSSFGAFERKSM